MKLRNWIEVAVGRQVAWVVCVGSKGGRKYYAVTFMDGTEADYYIDYENETVEEF